MKRSGKNLKGKLLSIWVPATLLMSLDKVARKENVNRSNFVRNAIGEKLSRHRNAANHENQHQTEGPRR